MDPLDFLNEEIGRRRMLRRSALGATALAASAVLPTGCAGYPSPPETLQTFSDKEFAILAAAFDTIIPKTKPDELSVGEARAAQRLDAGLAAAAPEVVKQVKQLLLVFEHATPLAGKFSRFTLLSAEDRHAYVESWQTSASPFRKTVFVVLKKLAVVSYYGNEATWRHLDYDGPMKTRPGAPEPIGISTIAAGNPSAAAPGPRAIEGA